MKPSVIVRMILPVLWQSFSALAVQTEVCGAAMMSPGYNNLYKAKRTQGYSEREITDFKSGGHNKRAWD